MAKEEKEGQFTSAGTETDKIPLRISHRIVELFSEGLYSSPNKAVEELVSNSFDAGANNVHIILASDLRADDATIVVIDDGEGMGIDGLKRHWVIGKSTRRKIEDKRGRKPIGKFGIGKLSTFVLASKLTHISKIDGKYFAATMDYSTLAGDFAKGSDAVFDEKIIEIPLRELTEDEAKLALSTWLKGKKPGFKAIELFGKDSTDSWTVAIMSDLKKLGKEIQIGRLKWVLRTAMPQQSDFHLFLDGDPITAPEIQEPFEHLVIGKDVIQMPAPCPEGLVARDDDDESEDSVHHYGVYEEKLLGRITGYIEIFEDELDAGKPKFEQSSGFFVYVRGRRVNEDDPGFGIERNQLRYGTFSRFRMVVHIDSLDEVLRSSRESFQQGATYEAVQNFLRAGFNLARNHLVVQDNSKSPGAIFAARVSSAAGSLTRKPLLSLADLIIKEKASPIYLRFTASLSRKDKSEFLDKFEEQADSPDGLLRDTELVVLDAKDGLAIFELDTGKLLINLSHPFVAAFQEHFTHPDKRLPLEMYAISEVLMEAQMYELGFDESQIRDVLARRDELFRQLVRSTSK
ncbi:MAG: ATP-binding protein, partial [Pyrinomonadaceae bacterium]